MEKIAITMGDPSGIGPEIIIKALQDIETLDNLLIIGNQEVFRRNEKICKLKLPNNIEFLNIDFDTSKIVNGVESEFSGKLAYQCLKKACNLVNENEVKSIATAPVSKNALHLAGYNYSGQTEILEKEIGGNNEAQMLFVAENLRILLLTRHIPLKNVPENITEANIKNCAKILHNELQNRFHINNPKLAMCALNPHAGENGILGDEEISIINPAIKKLQYSGINILGAYSADALLSKEIINCKNSNYDAIIACYHDQALPAIKSLGLDKVLNVTVGLKALRVSPSHGTAFDIAYQNKANYSSMLNAIKFLQQI